MWYNISKKYWQNMSENQYRNAQTQVHSNMVVPVAGMGPARGIGDVSLAFVTTRLPPLLGFGQSKQTLQYITIKSSP